MSRKRKNKRKRRKETGSSKHGKNKGTTIKSSKIVIDHSLPESSDQDSKDLRNDEILNLGYDRSVIESKTRIIYERLLDGSKYLDQGNFNRIGSPDLKRMFELYDEIFFDGYFSKNCPDNVFFKISRRMTRAGGKTEVYNDPKIYVIKLSSSLLFQSFKDEDREVVVNGIVCRDRLEAAMHIFEHEIIHLLEFVLFGRSSCSKPRFISLSNSIFGHIDVKHRLVTGYEIADKKYGINVGDAVSFEFEGELCKGHILRITKRATVMVSDPEGQHRDFGGKRYCKYYIPLDHLKLLS